MEKPLESTHIALPSGGWWEISTRPLWRHLRAWTDAVGDKAHNGELLDFALASVTTAWSFDEELSAESVGHREPADQEAAIQALKARVISPMTSEDSVSAAEALFAALLEGRVPPRFADVAIMEATGWSWRTLQDTPADVVRRMTVYLLVRQVLAKGGALDYPGEKRGRNAE